MSQDYILIAKTNRKLMLSMMPKLGRRVILICQTVLQQDNVNLGLSPLSVLLDVFDDSDGERNLVIAIHIPSGTAKTEFVVSVGNGGQVLEIQYSWPKVMADVSSLLNFRLESTERSQNIEPYHPLVNGFRNFFSSVQKEGVRQHYKSY